jgi:hypothetical protein
MRKWVMLLATTVPFAMPADTGGMTGPVSGFFVDVRANAIRAIEGLPGAARLGATVRLPFAVARAAIASRQDYALAVAVRGAGLPILVRGLSAAAPEIVAIGGAVDASLLAVASSGSAVLYSKTAGQVQFIDGLPGAPSASEPIDAGVLGGGAVALAIDDAGASAVLAAADGQIYVASRGGATPLRAVARLRGASSLAMLPGGASVLAASAETGDVILIEGLAGAVSVRAVGGSAGGLGAARSVAALDALTAGVILADGRLAAVDLQGGSVEWIALAGAAESFESLDRTLFVLNRAGDGPLLLLYSAQGRSAWFVPPDRQPGVGRRTGAGNGGGDRPY